MKKIIIFSILLLFFSGCVNSTKQTNLQKETELTVGIVQKEIKIGMTQAEVASVLGSPNIVSSSEQNKETWIYDKISSNISYKKDSAYGTLILVGDLSKSGDITTSQKTLTIIINFIKGKINDFKYHTSKF